MRNILYSIGMILLTASVSIAANLGCFEPSQTVQVWAQFRGGDGVAVSPTSPTAKVFSPTDTTSASFTPTVAEIDSSGSPGMVRGSFTLGASPTLGIWTVQYKGTINSVVHVGVDTFEVRTTGKCGTVPPANFSSMSIDGSGRVKANSVDQNYNVVDLTNESGDQNPTTTSFDTDMTQTVNVSSTSPSPILYFPTVEQEPTQDVNCNVQGLRARITAYNTSTKVLTVTALPAAPDYRCKFRIY